MEFDLEWDACSLWLLQHQVSAVLRWPWTWNYRIFIFIVFSFNNPLSRSYQLITISYMNLKIYWCQFVLRYLDDLILRFNLYKFLLQFGISLLFVCRQAQIANAVQAHFFVDNLTEVSSCMMFPLHLYCFRTVLIISFLQVFPLPCSLAKLKLLLSLYAPRAV